MTVTTELQEIKGASERALAAAIEFFGAWSSAEETRPLDRVMESAYRNHRELNSSERRWISATVYGTVRFLRRQRFLLERLGLEDNPSNLIRLWAQSPADGSEGASFRHSEPVADPEKLAEAIGKLPAKSDPSDYLRIALSFPDSMAAELEEILGGEAIAAGESLNGQAPSTLRANTLKIARDRLIHRLPPGIGSPTRFSPNGIELVARTNIPELFGWKQGLFEVQEEASQLVAQLLDPKPGDVVADVGAGAGGKTLALAAQMENKGRIIALDLPSLRFDQLPERARKAGVSILEFLPIEADGNGQWSANEASQKKLDRIMGKCDAVLVDAPCTGSGTLRRNPDSRWREDENAQFATLQSVILAQSAPLVRPGGRLVYATCAFERAQNEAVIGRFLQSDAGREFTVEPLPKRFAAFASGDAFRSWAHRHSLDLFFAQRLRRVDA